MTTISEFSSRIRRRLTGERSESIGVLSVAIDNSETGITFVTDIALARVGIVLEVDDEQLYITAVAGSARTVIRGWNGTTAAAHLINSIVRVQPRWTSQEITELITEEITSWPVQLGRIRTQEVTLGAREYMVELPVAAGESVTRLLNSELIRTNVTHPKRYRIDVGLVHDADADEFTSGWGVRLNNVLGYDVVLQIDYLVNYDLTSFAGTQDLTTDLGLRAELLDVLLYGCLWRALSTREVARTSSAAMTAGSAEQVPPTHRIQASSALAQVRDTRLNEELGRMNSLYPVLMSSTS